MSRASEEKARELVQLLTIHQYTSKLYVIPFGEIQRDIVGELPPAPFRVVLDPACHDPHRTGISQTRALLGTRSRATA